MSDVLCIYYSRTGHTKKAMEEIAEALDAELVELNDGVDRSGLRGALRSGRDAMRKECVPLQAFQTEKALGEYQLVIVGTPVWAGRCSSVIRSFLKQHGKKLRRAAYIITRYSEDKSEQVFDQMDQYVPSGHQAAVSLRSGSVGYAFWQEEFLRQVRELLSQQ